MRTTKKAVTDVSRNRRMKRFPVQAGGGSRTELTVESVVSLGYWSPLMTGGPTSEMVLTPDGDAIMVFVET